MNSLDYCRLICHIKLEKVKGKNLCKKRGYLCLLKLTTDRDYYNLEYSQRKFNIIVSLMFTMAGSTLVNGVFTVEINY